MCRNMAYCGTLYTNFNFKDWSVAYCCICIHVGREPGNEASDKVWWCIDLWYRDHWHAAGCMQTPGWYNGALQTTGNSLAVGTVMYNGSDIMYLHVHAKPVHMYLESTKSQPYYTHTDLETTLSESCSKAPYIILWSAQFGKWVCIIALVANQEGNLFTCYIHTMRMKRFIHTEWPHLVCLIYLPNLLSSVVFKCLLAINVHVQGVQKELWILIYEHDISYDLNHPNHKTSVLMTHVHWRQNWKYS